MKELISNETAQEEHKYQAEAQKLLDGIQENLRLARISQENTRINHEATEALMVELFATLRTFEN